MFSRKKKSYIKLKKRIGSNTAKLFISDMKVNTIMWGVKTGKGRG